MIRLTLPVPLARLMQVNDSRNGSGPLTVLMAARNWPEFVHEVRGRYPVLADRVFTASGALTAGFVLVINDEAQPTRGGHFHRLKDGDDVALITAMAGG
jgi:molybdopterin converting factor small subunit